MTHRLRVLRSRGERKPRLLLVDDHPGVLDRVATMLAGDFDVAGLATDGRQALEVAERVNPDVIVLDINMPGVDGFQTMRALERTGSHAPVVFLSNVDTDDVVDEAFRCGGRGYVLKPQTASDLASAIDQVHLGRMFVPSLTSLFRLAGGAGHAMQLHGEIRSFLDGAADFLDLALRRGDATCVIATTHVRNGLQTRLRARGWDVGGASGHKRCLILDADDALRRCMRGGLPDPGIIAEMVAELEEYRAAVTDHAAARLTIVGNMVVSLIGDGNPQAAVALERLWNKTTHNLPFFTLCEYATSCFHDPTSDLWSRVCAEHWAVSHAAEL